MNRKTLTETNSTLGALLRYPYERMAAWLYAELAELGYTEVRPAYSAVLRNLSATGSRVSELALRAGMTKQSMGYLVDQMAVAGRRANTVRLTPRGEALVATSIELSKRYEARLVELVGERKMQQLRTVLEELYLKLADDSEAG
jgi:DNA-binding MarR family transcriptional regulator